MSDMYSDDRITYGGVSKGRGSRINVVIRKDEGDLLVELWEEEDSAPVPRQHKAMEFELRKALYLAMILQGAEADYR